MMKAMNCFYWMVDQQKTIRLISRRDHCQKFSPSQISDTARGFELTQNLSLGFGESGCAIVIALTSRHHITTTSRRRNYFFLKYCTIVFCATLTVIALKSSQFVPLCKGAFWGIHCSLFECVSLFLESCFCSYGILYRQYWQYSNDQ